MNSKSSYKIELLDNLIKVDLYGVWTAQMDLKYLSELSDTMVQMRVNSWALLIDMRGWQVPEDVYQSNCAFKIDLDRRNQLLECWIVDEPNQAEFILPHFAQASFKPNRCLDMRTAKKVLTEHGFRI